MFHVFQPFSQFRPFAAPRRGGLPSVASLFADGEQGGLWLFDAAYQDSAGTTAADAQDDPVGLVLDQRYGTPEPRRNLMTWSEDFSQSVWITPNGATKSGNVCTLPNLNGYEGFFQEVNPLLPEREYKAHIVLTGNTGETVHISYGVASVTFSQQITFTGSEQTLEFPVRSPSANLLQIKVLRHPGDTATSITLHKAWLVDVTGLDPSEYPDYQKIESGIGGEWSPGTHAIQTTTASKPILNYTPVTNKPWLSADSDDSLPVTFTESLGSNCTIARLGADGVTWQESQTVGTTFDLVQESQYNGGAFLIDRALSVAEKRAVERALKKYEPQAGEWP